MIVLSFDPHIIVMRQGGGQDGCHNHNKRCFLHKTAINCCIKTVPCALKFIFPVYIHINLIITRLIIMRFSLQHGHVMAPKLIILLYVYSKQPHYNTVSLITRSASMVPKDSVIMRLYCTSFLFWFQL